MRNQEEEEVVGRSEKKGRFPHVDLNIRKPSKVPENARSSRPQAVAFVFLRVFLITSVSTSFTSPGCSIAGAAGFS